MLARQRQTLILARVREDGGVRVADLARELGVSDMTVRRDLELLDNRGLIEKVHGGATALPGQRPVRARVRREVEPPGDREGGDRRRRLRPRRAGHRDRDLGRDDDLRARAAPRRRGRPHGRHELRAGRRRPPSRRSRRSDDHPDRRRPHAVGRPGRSVRRRRAPDDPPRPGLPRRPRHGPAVRVHDARTSSRPTPTGRSPPPGAGSSSSPTPASGA